MVNPLFLFLLERISIFPGQFSHQGPEGIGQIRQGSHKSAALIGGRGQDIGEEALELVPLRVGDGHVTLTGAEPFLPDPELPADVGDGAVAGTCNARTHLRDKRLRNIETFCKFGFCGRLYYVRLPQLQHEAERFLPE